MQDLPSLSIGKNKMRFDPMYSSWETCKA